MEAKDLMIGDWVQICYRDRKVKVTAIYDELIDTSSVSPLMKDEYEPIPLTDEILKKNGFEKEIGAKEVVFTCDDDDKNYRLVIHPKETNYCGIYTYIHIDAGCISIEELPLEYVHELQHALRLCGIEKEIVL